MWRQMFCALLLAACGGGAGNENTAVLAALYGDYEVTFTGRTGGPYEPSGSIVSGTTRGVVDFSLPGTVTIAPSRPGVIAVPDGMTIPGIDPATILFGAAVMQNPLHVFLGTRTATVAGDFGLHTLLTFNMPEGSNELHYTGCEEGAAGAFSCVPMFFRRQATLGRTVNLTYFVNRARGDARGITIDGTLVDTHAAEAAVANTYMVPIESPIVGSINDIFSFAQGAVFTLTVSGRTVTGSIQGSGRSVATMVPQTAIFEATFTGTKR